MIDDDAIDYGEQIAADRDDLDAEEARIQRKYDPWGGPRDRSDWPLSCRCEVCNAAMGERHLQVVPE